jgi:putative ABC transport system permease protein
MNDLKHALRLFIQTPGFTLIAILVLAIGIAVGLVGGVLAGLGLRGLLMGVSPLDPIVLLGTTGLLGAIVIAACLVPARRATRINPVEALRSE